MRAERSLFEHTAALSSQYLTYTGGPRPEHVVAAQASSEWFDVLGAKPLLGRVFAPEEDQPNGRRVAVLSYSSWARLFLSEPAVIGRKIELDLQPYTVIGVMKPGIEWSGRRTSGFLLLFPRRISRPRKIFMSICLCWRDFAPAFPRKRPTPG